MVTREINILFLNSAEDAQVLIGEKTSHSSGGRENAAKTQGPLAWLAEVDEMDRFAFIF